MCTTEKLTRINALIAETDESNELTVRELRTIENALNDLADASGYPTALAHLRALAAKVGRIAGSK